MAYSRRILATGTAFDVDIEDNGVWTLADVNGDGSPDLVYIKTRNTSSGKVEVHTSPYEFCFQEQILTTVTAFNPEDNGTYFMQDYTGDGKADLVYIKTRNTGSKRVEVHVASADSDYQLVCIMRTCFAEEDDGVWTLSDKGDLICIKASNIAGKIEIHIARRSPERSSSYQTLTVSTQTNFALDDNGTWCIVSNTRDTYPDLYYIKTRGGVSSVEVHAISASSNWQTRFIDVSSSFEPEENGHWLMSSLTHQDQPDLVYIKTRNTRTNQVEIHAAASKPYTPKTYVESSRDIWLQQSTLRAQLQRNDGSWRSASIDLNDVIGNIDGKFSWGCKLFIDSAKDLRLEGAVLKAELKRSDNSWASDTIDLQDRLMNNDGAFQAVEVPVIIAIPLEQEQALLSQLADAMNNPNFHLQACKDPDGTTTFHASGIGGSTEITCNAEASASIFLIAQEKGKAIEQLSVNVISDEASIPTGVYAGVGAQDNQVGEMPFLLSGWSQYNLIPDPNLPPATMDQLIEAVNDPNFRVQARDNPDGTTLFYANAEAGPKVGSIMVTLGAEARISLFRIADTKGKPIQQFRADFFSLYGGVQTGGYNGVEAQLSLINAEISCVDINIGIGVSTGFGIKDGTFKAKISGLGFQVGKKMGFTFFDNSVSIDFGKFFGWF